MQTHYFSWLRAAIVFGAALYAWAPAAHAQSLWHVDFASPPCSASEYSNADSIGCVIEFECDDGDNRPGSQKITSWKKSP